MKGGVEGGVEVALLVLRPCLHLAQLVLPRQPLRPPHEQALPERVATIA